MCTTPCSLQLFSSVRNLLEPEVLEGETVDDEGWFEHPGFAILEDLAEGDERYS